MRDALRWVCAVVTYTLVLWVVFFLAMVIAMGDHVAGGEGGFHVGNPSLRLAALLMVVIGGHSLACASAVSIAPAHRRIVGGVAVALPVAYLIKETGYGDADDLFFQFVNLLFGIPTAVCTYLTLQRLDRRAAASPTCRSKAGRLSSRRVRPGWGGLNIM